MLNTLKIGLVTASTVAVLATAPLSFAQTPTLRPVPQLKCDKVAVKIDALAIKAQVRHDQIVDQHKKVTTWWSNIGKDKFIAKYGQSAYDTLSADFTTLHDTYGMPLETDAQTYVNDLKSLQTMSQGGDCGTSNGAFATELKTVKADRSKVQTDVQNWRNYFNNTIRVYIKSLRGTTTTPIPTP